MVPLDDSGDQAFELLTNPTLDTWEAELLSLIGGNRAIQVARLGTVAEYVEVLLANSRSAINARLAFLAALRRVVETWQPAREEDPSALSRILDLLSAFTPAEGFVKLAGFMQRGWYFPTIQSVVADRQGPLDLHLKALVALKNYFPAPPPDEGALGPAFESYVSLLTGYLENPTYSKHAAVRLWQVARLPYGSRIASDIFIRDPEIVSALARAILRGATTTIERDLSTLYSECLRVGRKAVRAFESAIEAAGAKLFHGQEGVPSITFGGGLFRLAVPSMEIYLMEHRWRGQTARLNSLEIILSRSNGSPAPE